MSSKDECGESSISSLGAPLSNPVQVVPHDPAWKAQYAKEADQLASVLGDIVVALHHIGSSAIPEIAAKPIIDILLEVESIARLDEVSPVVE